MNLSFILNEIDPPIDLPIKREMKREMPSYIIISPIETNDADNVGMIRYKTDIGHTTIIAQSSKVIMQGASSLRS